MSVWRCKQWLSFCVNADFANCYAFVIYFEAPFFYKRM